jgi:hypothetical protein
MGNYNSYSKLPLENKKDLLCYKYKCTKTYDEKTRIFSCSCGLIEERRISKNTYRYLVKTGQKFNIKGSEQRNLKKFTKDNKLYWSKKQIKELINLHN